MSFVGIATRIPALVQGIADRLLRMALDSVFDVAARRTQFPDPERHWPLDIDRDWLHYTCCYDDLRPTTSPDDETALLGILDSRRTLAAWGHLHDRKSLSRAFSDVAELCPCCSVVYNRLTSNLSGRRVHDKIPTNQPMQRSTRSGGLAMVNQSRVPADGYRSP